MSEPQTPSDATPTDGFIQARLATASLLELLRQKNAGISFRYQRRCMITPADSDDPMIFLTIGFDGTPIPDGAIVVTDEGEFALTLDEMRAIADAVRDEE